MKDNLSEKEYLKLVNGIIKSSLEASYDTFDYKKMTNLLKNISGAKVVALNLYNSDLTKTKTVAISSSSALLSAATKVLGFSIKGKEWVIIPSRIKALQKSDFFHKSDLHTISFGAINKKTAKTLQKTIGIGDVYVLKVSHQGLIGDFILFTHKEEGLKNKNLIKDYVGHVESILTRYKTEKNLSESEHRFKSVFQNSPVSILIHDKDTGEIIDANKKAYTQYGFKKIEQLKENDFWMEPPYSEKEALKWMHKASKEGVQSFEWKSRKSNGDIFWEIITLSPITIDGKKRILATTIDISEIKRIEEELNLNENRYEELARQSKTFIWEVDPKGRYLYVSDNVKDVIGFSKEELIKKRVFDIHPEKGKKDFKKEVLGILKNKESISGMENPIMHKNGKVVWVLSAGLPVLDNKGNLIKYRGTDTDISKIKEIEKELQRKKEDHETLVSNIPGVTYRCLFDKEWTMLYISEEVSKLTGYSTKDLADNKTISYANIIHDAYKEHVEKEIKKNISKKEPWEIEYVIVCKNNKLKWVMEKGQAVFDSKGNAKTLNGIIFDISDRKKIENELESNKQELEKFKLAVENASDHIVITDNDGFCLYANDMVEKITGFSKEDVIGYKVGTEDNWGGLMEKSVYDELWTTIKEKKKPFTGEMKNKRKNGEEYYAQANISPVLNEDGEVVFFVAIERDITAEKEIDKAKTEFVSLASHQLRTPLSTVNWYTEMLISGDAGEINEEQENYLQEIYSGNQRMVELVNSLLNVSRLELGTFTVTPEKVDVVEMTKSIIKDISINIEEKKQNLKENYKDNLPKIDADPKLLRIVIENLLSNATKYTPEEGELKIDIHKDKKNMVITVSDNGYGISEYQQEKVFQKLFRADNILERDTEGTGLGLYIIKSILDHSGGSIRFQSKEGEGTTFYVTIPLSGMKKREGAKTLT